MFLLVLLLVISSDELFPYQEMGFRRQMTNQQLLPGDGSDGARWACFTVRTCTGEAKHSSSIHCHPKHSEIIAAPRKPEPTPGRAAHPTEVSRADVLNTWQQVLALIPLKPAAKAPI